MDGFFDGDDQKALKAQLRLCPSECNKCKAYRSCRSPKIKPQGNPNGSVLIILDSPTESNDIQNKWVCGEEGNMLNMIFDAYSESTNFIANECCVMGAVQCKRELKPSSMDIGYCRSNIFKQIKIQRPRVIILMGESSIRSFLQHRWHKALDAEDYSGGGKKTSWESIVRRWRGIAIPDQEYNCWVIATFKPSDLFSTYVNSAPLLFQKDIELALSKINKPVPRYYPEKEISIYNEKQAIQFLNLTRDTTITFDYETSGLKPYHPLHFIYSVSIYNPDLDTCCAFLLTENIEPYWTRVLEDSRVGKIAHNAKFEDTWSRVILKADVQNWVRDTLMLAHYNDNRVGYTGLKFQAYINFGIIDYSSEIEPFLKAKDGELINQIRNAPVKKVLTYNALDSVFTQWLVWKNNLHKAGYEFEQTSIYPGDES